MRVSVVSVAVFATSRLKSMGRIGIARAVASASDWPLPVPVSVQWALSALAVSVRVSVACRAIGAAPTTPMHRHQIRQGRGKNTWRRWTPRISVKIIWNRLAFGLRQHFPPKVSHRQGSWRRNQVKHRNRNQYPHRCRRSQCQRQQYRQPRQGNRIHNYYDKLWLVINRTRYWLIPVRSFAQFPMKRQAILSIIAGISKKHSPPHLKEEENDDF